MSGKLMTLEDLVKCAKGMDSKFLVHEDGKILSFAGFPTKLKGKFISIIGCDIEKQQPDWSFDYIDQYVIDFFIENDGYVFDLTVERFRFDIPKTEFQFIVSSNDIKILNAAVRQDFSYVYVDKTGTVWLLDKNDINSPNKLISKHGRMSCCWIKEDEFLECIFDLKDYRDISVRTGTLIAKSLDKKTVFEFETAKYNGAFMEEMSKIIKQGAFLPIVTADTHVYSSFGKTPEIKKCCSIERSDYLAKDREFYYTFKIANDCDVTLPESRLYKQPSIYTEDHGTVEDTRGKYISMEYPSPYVPFSYRVEYKLYYAEKYNADDISYIAFLLQLKKKFQRYDESPFNYFKNVKNFTGYETIQFRKSPSSNYILGSVTSIKFNDENEIVLKLNTEAFKEHNEKFQEKVKKVESVTIRKESSHVFLFKDIYGIYANYKLAGDSDTESFTEYLEKILYKDGIRPYIFSN